jgi:mannose-6-phosphate isomerase-like protein (cupin superfamily)
MFKKICLGSGLFIALLTAVVTITAQSPMPPGLYFSANEFSSGIAQDSGNRPGMAVSRFILNDDYRINMVHRTTAAGAIIHDVGTELHYITEGAGTLVTGGVIVRPAGGGSATIEGGLARRVSVGDAVLIPVGTPHWYSEVEQSVTYLEVRF